MADTQGEMDRISPHYSSLWPVFIRSQVRGLQREGGAPQKGNKRPAYRQSIVCSNLGGEARTAFVVRGVGESQNASHSCSVMGIFYGGLVFGAKHLYHTKPSFR